MITLFKKNIHSFFFTLPPNTTKTGGGGDGGDDYRLQFHQPISSGLVSAITRDPDRPPNVVESSKLMKPNSQPSSPSASGFTHEIGGGEVNGLTSCTESLGFESSDEREIQNTPNNNHHHHHHHPGYYNKKTVSSDWRSRSGRRGECRNKARSFPPPLSSLNRNGEPSFFLRPVRKDGRLELTEVRIHRPQILHAWRHDGRLTLHFVPDRSIEEEEIEEDEIVEQELQEEKEVAKKEQLVTIDEEEEKEEEEEEEGYGEYRFGTNEGLRCHQMVNHHHHHHHHLRMCGISTV